MFIWCLSGDLALVFVNSGCVFRVMRSLDSVEGGMCGVCN